MFFYVDVSANMFRTAVRALWHLPVLAKKASAVELKQYVERCKSVASTDYLLDEELVRFVYLKLLL